MNKYNLEFIQFRLKQCRLENKMYLVEHEKKYYGLPLSHLQQALANTEIIDGFTIVRTECHLESMRYIANLSNLLTNMYKVKFNILLFYIDKYVYVIDPEILNLLQNKTLRNNFDEIDSGYNDSSNSVQLISFKTFSADSAKNKVCYYLLLNKLVLCILFSIKCINFLEYDCTRYVN